MSKTHPELRRALITFVFRAIHHMSGPTLAQKQKAADDFQWFSSIPNSDTANVPSMLAGDHPAGDRAWACAAAMMAGSAGHESGMTSILGMVARAKGPSVGETWATISASIAAAKKSIGAMDDDLSQEQIAALLDDAEFEPGGIIATRRRPPVISPEAKAAADAVIAKVSGAH